MLNQLILQVFSCGLGEIERKGTYLRNPFLAEAPRTKFSIAACETYSVNALATSMSSNMMSLHCI